MPRPIAFLRPTSVAEAVAMLAEHGEDAKVVAGSTALTIMLRQGLIEPGVLVSIGRMEDPGLRTITRDGDRLHIGALVTHRAVERDPAVRAAIPVLADAFAAYLEFKLGQAPGSGGPEARTSSPPQSHLSGNDGG